MFQTTNQIVSFVFRKIFFLCKFQSFAAIFLPVLLLSPSDDDPGAGHLCLVQIDQRPKDLLHDDCLGVPILFFLED